MNLRISLFSVVLSIIFGAIVEGRTFTDAKGRKIEAELVAHAGEKIVISRSGKKFTVSISAFSEADQKYIKEWIAKNPDAVDMDYKFRFYADHKRSASVTQRGGVAIQDKLKFKDNTYEMIVYNNGSTEVVGVDIRYEIYVADFVVMKRNKYFGLAVGADKESELEVIAGELKNHSIPVKGRVDFERTFSTEFYIDRDGSRKDAAAEDQVIGVKIRVYKAGKLLGEYSHGVDTDRMAKVKWRDKRPGDQDR